MPAATSSSTMPVPAGNFSSCRTGGGFRISKIRKSIKPARKVFHVSGTEISAISCPATSSITTNCGSLVPDARATWVDAGMPIRVTRSAAAIPTGIRSVGLNSYAAADHNRTVAADPQVPGPGRIRPMPKKVATALAHAGPRTSSIVNCSVTNRSPDRRDYDRESTLRRR